MKTMIYLCNALILSLLCGTVLADELRLKSGGSMTGLIVNEANGIVTIHIGFGTAEFDTSEIDTILYSNKAEQAQLKAQIEKQSTGDSLAALPELQPLKAAMRSLRELRKKAIDRKKHLDILRFEIDSINRTGTIRAEAYTSIQKDLNAMPKKDIREQLEIVGKANQFNASVLMGQQELQTKQKDYESGNPELLIYIDSLSRTVEAIDQFKLNQSADRKKKYAAALQSIDKSIQEFNQEFLSSSVDVTFIPGNHIIVPVKFNAKITAFLLFDTGASSVTLSEDLARRIGIDWKNGIKVNATLANGETVTGYSIIMTSIRVADFIVKNVRCVVLPKKPGEKIDGLLGMSFLDRFLINIDPANKKLLLKRFGLND